MENVNKEEFTRYLENVSNRIKHLSIHYSKLEELENYPLFPSQCIYITNLRDKKIVFQKGIKDLLGYEKHEFTFDLATSYFHPEDYERVTEIIQIVIDFSNEYAPPLHKCLFSLTYRLKKKDGTYLKVLRQSTIFKQGPKGEFLGNLSVISDISFMHTGIRVDWTLTATEDIKMNFEKIIKQAHHNYFTKRELEILFMIREGKESKVIADELYISPHTVNTHRRNMLKNAGCSNTIELLYFAGKNGIL